MKMTKRIAAAVAAMTMAVSVMAATGSMGAWAAPSTPTYSITLGTTSQTYTYYQIFKGTYSNEKLLDEDLEFGSGVNAAAFKTELGLESDATAADALAVMDGMTDSELLPILKKAGVLGNGTALTSGSTTTVDQGYYYILEEEDDTSADILMKVDGAETITPKLGAPKVEKKIKENVREVSLGDVMDEDLYEEDGFNDTADYCIGDSIPFEVVGSMPEHIGSYKNYYYYEFTDRLGKGFVKPAASDIKVYLDGTTDITDKAVITVTQEDTSKPTTISIKFANIKAAGTITKDSKIVVKYSAVLDTDAVIGNAGNTNGVKLTYSTDTEWDGTGIPDTEETPEDGVVAFTYTIDTTKVKKGETTTKLADAKFMLLNSDKSKAAKISNDGKFVEWVAVDEGTVITTGTEGKFTVAGLDAGTYYIRETEAPEGYNKLKDDVTVTVNAVMNTTGNWGYVEDNGTSAFIRLSSDSLFVTDIAEGTIKGNIENAQGAELPETGGIGTTLFYVGGGAMAAAAGIVLVVRKRAKREQ